MTETPEVEPPFPLPEVRQNQDPADYLYGCTAVYAGTHPMTGEARWGCMHPINGGHWATGADVAEWTVLS